MCHETESQILNAEITKADRNLLQENIFFFLFFYSAYFSTVFQERVKLTEQIKLLIQVLNKNRIYRKNDNTPKSFKPLPTPPSKPKSLSRTDPVHRNVCNHPSESFK